MLHVACSDVREMETRHTRGKMPNEMRFKISYIVYARVGGQTIMGQHQYWSLIAIGIGWLAINCFSLSTFILYHQAWISSPRKHKLQINM